MLNKGEYKKLTLICYRAGVMTFSPAAPCLSLFIPRAKYPHHGVRGGRLGRGGAEN